MSDWRRRIVKLETERGAGAPGLLGELLRRCARDGVDAAISGWEKERGRRLPPAFVQKVARIAGSLVEIGREMRFATTGQSGPGCFVLPRVLSPEEWAEAAAEQQDALTGQGSRPG